jgi:hypothetical protein
MTDFEGDTGDKLEYRKLLFKISYTLIHSWSICELYGKVMLQLICTIYLKAMIEAKISLRLKPKCWVIMEYFSRFLTGDVITRRV